MDIQEIALKAAENAIAATNFSPEALKAFCKRKGMSCGTNPDTVKYLLEMDVKGKTYTDVIHRLEPSSDMACQTLRRWVNKFFANPSSVRFEREIVVPMGTLVVRAGPYNKHRVLFEVRMGDTLVAGVEFARRGGARKDVRHTTPKGVTGDAVIDAVRACTRSAFEAAETTQKTIKARAYPRSANQLTGPFAWSGDMYQTMCKHMREKTQPPAPVRDAMRSIDAYFKHTAPRAPSAPVSVPTLWRGISVRSDEHWAAAMVPGATVESSGGCYTAMSVHEKQARDFAGSSDGVRTAFVVQLHESNVARGTPWIWLTESRRPATRAARRRGMRSHVPTEGEVLLPPGYFTILHFHTDEDGVRTVEVSYVPKPTYLPRAQFRDVAKTMRGKSPNLDENLTHRHARVRARNVVHTVKASRRHPASHALL